MRLNDLLALSHVPRWSVVPHHRPQSVADHTFRTMVIYVDLCERLQVEANSRTMRWILVHDGPESVTADIPGNFKDKLEGIHRLEQQVCPWFAEESIDALSMSMLDSALVTLADKMEGLSFILREGYGPHAQVCAEYCRDGVRRAAIQVQKELNPKPIISADMVAEAMINMIVQEAGREPHNRYQKLGS